MELLQFTKVLPGGNTTILIESSVPLSLRPALSKKILDGKLLEGEQVGFVMEPKAADADVRLEMMGQELCINAIRSLSALLFSRDKTKNTLRIESSGTDTVILCHNRMEGEDIYTGVELTVKNRVEIREEKSLVSLDGIAHIVCQTDLSHDDAHHHSAFMAASDLFESELAYYAAYGYMPYDHLDEHVSTFKPIVYVKDTNSTIFETGCGSGTIATAIVRFLEEGVETTVMRQPSGYDYVTRIHRTTDNSLHISLESIVRILEEGSINIENIDK